MNLKVYKILSVFLWLVSFHSFLVGIGLIILPASAFESLGYNTNFDRFFSTQGGVFHIAMSICYSMAAYNLKHNEQLIIFSIIVKFLATFFLVIYFIFINQLLLIIFSGVSDFAMGLIILILYKKVKSKNYFSTV